jgi:3-hydroxyacyl-[acyl-carrier-protein] dehydratase
MVQPVFKILSTEHSESAIVTVLAVDADSDILKGHFPEQPVVPGACMLQTVKEVLENTFHASFKLIKADNIKFLNMITPDSTDLSLNINYQLLDNDVKVVAELTGESVVFMKLQATFNER